MGNLLKSKNSNMSFKKEICLKCSSLIDAKKFLENILNSDNFEKVILFLSEVNITSLFQENTTQMILLIRSCFSLLSDVAKDLNPHIISVQNLTNSAKLVNRFLPYLGKMKNLNKLIFTTNIVASNIDEEGIKILLEKESNLNESSHNHYIELCDSIMRILFKPGLTVEKPKISKP